MITLRLDGVLPEDPDAEVRAALERLKAGATLDELLALVPGDRSKVRFLMHLESLRVIRSCAAADLWTSKPAPGRPATRALSRFARLRSEDEWLVLETPLSDAWIRVRDAAAFQRREDPDLLQLLHQGRFLADADAGAEHWEAHDLIFHMRSRAGRHGRAMGATWRGEPLPALKAPPAGPRTPLYRPTSFNDDPLQDVVERRASEREPAGLLTLRELGEFLWRTARVRERRSRAITRNGAEMKTDHATRPFPSSGAMYPLEIYPVVSRCDGLAPGLYWHDPSAHELARIAEGGDELLADAARITGRAEPPQVLLAVAARFGRLTWKYSGMAYAALLKDAGVLLQTFCLAAAAMRLSGCPVGFGDAERFAALAGLDPLAESTVAEFILGGAPPVLK